MAERPFQLRSRVPRSWDLRTRPQEPTGNVLRAPPSLLVLNRNHGILSRLLERRLRREGALLIAGSEHEEEVAEIKRREGRRRSSSRAAHRALESRVATAGDWVPAILLFSGVPEAAQPRSDTRLSVFMASPDDPLRSGKVAPCRARTWSVTTNWVPKTEPLSPLRALQDTSTCARCVSGWMGTVVAHCSTSPNPTLVLPPL